MERELADLPTVPQKISITATDRTAGLILPAEAFNPANEMVPAVVEVLVEIQKRRMPSIKPKSPILLTMKACLAASAAESF